MNYKTVFFLFPLLLGTFSSARSQVPEHGTCCSEAIAEQEVKPIEIVKNFIYDLADPDIAEDVVLSQHVLTTNMDAELLDYLIASLQEIRINLLSKNLEDIHFLNYRDLPSKETADIDPEGKDVGNMFFLKHKSRQVVALYVDQGKIASFTLVSKGRNKAHFVTY